MVSNAAGISFSGINTGLDTKSIIAALMGVRAKPIVLLEDQKANLQKLSKAFTAFQGYLGALKTASDDLKDAKDLLHYSVSSSSEGVVTASADGSATASALSITVTALAQSEIEASQGYADFDTTTVGTGSLQITVGGTTKTITIAPGQDTLEGLRDAINDSGIDIDASIVNVGVGANPYKLVLTGSKTGDVNEITVDASGLTGGTQALAFTESQDAADAVFTVNGLTIQRASNDVDDVVVGVDFQLKSVGTATISLAPDAQKMKDAVTKYVSAHNDLVNFVNSQLKFNDSTDKAGSLSGESGVRTLKNRVLNLLASTGYPGGELSSLHSIGISVQKDSTITFDSTKFDVAITDHLDELVGMLTTKGDKISGQGLSLLKVPDNITAGTFNVTMTQAATKAAATASGAFAGGGALGQAENLTFTVGAKTFSVALAQGDDLAAALVKLNAKLDDEDVHVTATDSGGSLKFSADLFGSAYNFNVTSDVAASATSSGVDLGGFSALGQDVAGTIGGVAATGAGQVLTGTGAYNGVQVRSTASGATAGTVTVGPDGYFVRLFGLVDDALKNDGAVDARLDGIAKTIADIDKRILSMNDRLDKYGAQLASKFAALESIIGELNSKQAGFAAASSGFSINSKG